MICGAIYWPSRLTPILRSAHSFGNVSAGTRPRFRGHVFSPAYDINSNIFNRLTLALHLPFYV